MPAKFFDVGKQFFIAVIQCLNVCLKIDAFEYKAWRQTKLTINISF